MSEGQNSTAPGYKAPELSLLGDEHVQKYQETDGEVGYLWNGHPTLLFTVKGRKTGLPRTIPILFSQDGDNYVIMASMGGAPKHPAWYLNIVDNPRVQVQVKDKKFDAIARTAESPERERLWDAACVNWPNYNTYKSRTERVIPVVVLEPVKD